MSNNGHSYENLQTNEPVPVELYSEYWNDTAETELPPLGREDVDVRDWPNDMSSLNKSSLQLSRIGARNNIRNIPGFAWAHEERLNPPQMPPVLIDGLLHEGRTMGIAAPRGIGKTWLAMQLAVLLGRGCGRLLGQFEIKREASALIIEYEVDRAEMYKRFNMQAPSDSLPKTIAQFTMPLQTQIITRKSFDKTKKSSQEWMEAAIDQNIEAIIDGIRPNVVIIDPWRSFNGGQENNNDQTEAITSKLDALRRKYGIAVVVFHHFKKSDNKTDRDPEDYWRGASRLADWVGTRVTLMPCVVNQLPEGADRGQLKRHVEIHTLVRSFKPNPICYARLSEFGSWERFTPNEQASDRGLRINPEDIAAICRENGGAFGSIRQATKLLRCSSPETAKKYLDAAVNAGYLRVDRGQTHRYYLHNDAVGQITAAFPGASIDA